jgi:hypothetical protein
VAEPDLDRLGSVALLRPDTETKIRFVAAADEASARELLAALR